MLVVTRYHFVKKNHDKIVLYCKNHIVMRVACIVTSLVGDWKLKTQIWLLIVVFIFLLMFMLAVTLTSSSSCF